MIIVFSYENYNIIHNSENESESKTVDSFDIIIKTQIVSHDIFKREKGIPTTLILQMGGAEETNPPMIFGQGTFSSLGNDYYFTLKTSGDIVDQFDIFELDKCIPHPQYPKDFPCFEYLQ